jgi:C-terminal processing protease CtpA/Prc
MQAWQTVANEFFDPQGQYSQARWAARLLEVLKEHHGALHTQAETYQALHQLVSSLGDPYTTFLDASVRQGLGQHEWWCSHTGCGTRGLRPCCC